MRNSCVEISVYGERTYRIFLDIIKQELDLMNVVDINAIQAFVLMNIGENIVTMGEVLSRGYYIGSNASYNLKKMIANGYIQQTQSDYDKRTSFLKLTEKGISLCEKLDRSINSHSKSLENNFKDKFGLDDGVGFLKGVETFWKDVLMSRI